MKNDPKSSAVIVMPALNEGPNLEWLLPKLQEYRVVVVDNGSTDDTAEVAKRYGAEVLHCAERGYGIAVLTGLQWLAPHMRDQDVIAVFDADGTSPVESIQDVVRPLESGETDFVIAQRTMRDRGAMPPHAKFGNWLATTMIRWLTGKSYVDMGPLRALRWAEWHAMAMQDRTWGWNVEMQVKAAVLGFRVAEIEIQYARRIHGKSKISGSIIGSIRAGTRILYSVPYYFWVARTLRARRSGVKDKSPSDI